VSDVALVAMPFGPMLYPSIALSLLKPALVRRGHSCDTFYFMLDYAERVGMRFYDNIAYSHQPPLGKLPGEWIFGGQITDRSEGDVRDYVEKVLKTRRTGIRRSAKPVPKRTIDKMVATERDASAFLDECVAKLLRARPRIVGMTSTFQQHAASLALAKRIKEADPSIVTVLGGPNCEGIMGAESCRQFPFVDAVVSGEGDFAFPELVRRVLAGESFDDMPGVYTQRNVHNAFAMQRFDNTAAIFELDTVPEVDYDDYLGAFRKTRFFRNWQPRLLFETSRGCWWGERMHCTFCGLNGNTMKFRSKSPERALSEMQSIAGRYPGYDVDVTDNILDMRYFETVLPQLAELKIEGMALFYETKANLRKQQVRILRDAGITRIQPGIESLSDAVLKIMRKGVTALQNLQLIKWCTELGVVAQWNLLCGFPGEPPEEYERMAKMLPLLTHLNPPEYFMPIRMDRFSPNFAEADKLGFTNIRPFDAYRYVYGGLPDEAVYNLACYFRFDYQEARDVDRYAIPVRDACQSWREVHAQSALIAIDAADQLILWDLRPVAKQAVTVLSGFERNLYLQCDAVATLRQLSQSLNLPAETIEASITRLVDLGLMLREGDRMLALAIAAGGEYAPPPQIIERIPDFPAIQSAMHVVQGGA